MNTQGTHQKMLRLLSFHPQLEFEWPDRGSANDDQGRIVIEFGLIIRYEDNFRMAVVSPFKVFRVPALTESDSEVFTTFHHALARAVEMCRPPMMKRWEEVIRERSFKTAEAAVITCPSFHAVLSNTPVELITPEHTYILCGRSFWIVESQELTAKDWLPFFKEFSRREQLSLPRLNPVEYFHHKVSVYERGHISEGVRREVWRRDRGKCIRCGGQVRLEFDHIIPVSKGGSNTTRNIQLLCESCNRAKGANIS